MKNWIIKKNSEIQSKIDLFSKELGLSPLISQVLVNRGLDSLEAAHDFLFLTLSALPSPFLLKDMNRAVDRIIQAIHAGEKIFIYGDYDVDGTVSTSLFVSFFKEMKVPLEFYIPQRLTEGYSLNKEALKKIRERGGTVIITVDNGISARNEALAAKELEIDLIVTDHHEVPPELPQAYAVINPMQEDCTYPDKRICGAGVAFNVLMALRQKLRESGFFSTHPEPNLKKYLDLLAIATVADVMPLVGVNRLFVKYGLAQLQNTAWCGLAALKKVSGCENNVMASHLGFRIGPRINACGRLYDASMGVRLLTCDNEGEAIKLAQQLDKANLERQEIETEILRSAIAKVFAIENYAEQMSFVLYDEEWHPGVIGIVASRLTEKFNRPVIMLGTDGTYLKGSARSYGGLSLIDALRSCHDHLVKYGGHKAAAGLTLTPENLSSFKEAFENAVASRLTKEDCIPRFEIEAVLNGAELNTAMIEELKKLEPFGMANPEPLFCLENQRVSSPRVISEKHLKFRLQSQAPLDVIGFGMAEHIQTLSHPINLVFSVKKDDYWNDGRLLLQLKDLKKG